jgi:hypothetical protein
MSGVEIRAIGLFSLWETRFSPTHPSPLIESVRRRARFASGIGRAKPASLKQRTPDTKMVASDSQRAGRANREGSGNNLIALGPRAQSW